MHLAAAAGGGGGVGSVKANDCCLLGGLRRRQSRRPLLLLECKNRSSHVFKQSEELQGNVQPRRGVSVGGAFFGGFF